MGSAMTFLDALKTGKPMRRKVDRGGLGRGVFLAFRDEGKAWDWYTTEGTEWCSSSLSREDMLAKDWEVQGE